MTITIDNFWGLMVVLIVLLLIANKSRIKYLFELIGLERLLKWLKNLPKF
jgi:hypothetical protein